MRMFDGRKDAVRAQAARRGEPVPRVFGDVALVQFDAFRKTTLTYAIKMDEAFMVDTIEGTMTGAAGDYLAIGAHGEMYPIDAAVFAASYVKADQ